MTQRSGKGCGCGCGSILIGLVILCLIMSGVVVAQAVALGDKPLTNPPAAAASGLTWNQLMADREAAKKESKGWNRGCDMGSAVGLFFGAPAYIIYPLAGANPAGRKSSWGQMIDPADWNKGMVPMNIPLPEGVFRTYQAYYWYNMVVGASSAHGLGGGCKLRPIQPATSGLGG